MKRGLLFFLYAFFISIATLLSELNHNTLELVWVSTLKLKPIFGFLLEYRIGLIVLIAIILVFLPNPQTVVSSNKLYGEIRIAILEQIRDQVFEGNLKDKRISIIAKCGRIKALWLHMKRIGRWILIKIRVDKLSNITLHRGTFLTVRHRLSDEDDSYTSKATFFCHHVNHKKCEGVAAVVTRGNRTKDITNLPDIENIDIKETYIKKEPIENFKALNTYMNGTHIKDARTLLKINRKARHFFGLAICGEKGTPVGSLLIDSMEDNFNLTDDQKNVLQIYTALLGKTF